MHAVTWTTRWSAVVILAALVAAPLAQAQSDDQDEERSRVVIRMDADSIRVERDGKVTVVPNTPEGRAQLDEEDLGFDTDRFRIEMDGDGFGLGGLDLDGDGRVFRFRSGESDFFGEGDFPRSFSIRGDGERSVEIERFGDGPRIAVRRGGPGGFSTFDLGAFGFGDEMRWSAEEAEAQAEILELELRTRELARDLREAEENEQAELEDELDALLGELFELKLEQQRSRVEMLEDELRAERERLDTRQDARDEVIERRKRQLLGDDVLEW
ncbi:MAG: hypothetical protein AAGG50_13940 [Bacteroidota bacterium]